MTEQAYEKMRLAAVIDVAENGAKPFIGEGDAKILGLLLGAKTGGECTVDISETKISVWYSWLPRVLPSSYDFSLAPGLLRRLMELGGVQSIVGEATFQVGPGTTGTGLYIFDFKRKWIRIKCASERIIIRVRDEQKDLVDRDPEHFAEIIRCEQCDGILRTPLARQCLECGYDWH